MASFAEKPVVMFETSEEFARFLEDDPPDSGVRVKLRKKNSTAPGITWAEAVDVALCYGWIDGQAGRFDDDYTLQAFTPRRARSPWSVINQENVERLIAEGRMRPGGLAEVERAKADGRWEAAYRMKDAVPSPEFQAALDANPAARARFDGLSKQERFAFIFRLANLRRPENRTRRIAEFVALLERGGSL